MSSKKGRRQKSSSSSVREKKAKPEKRYERIENTLNALQNNLEKIEILKISDENRMTSDVLTNAEKTNLIAVRAKQISQTGITFINPSDYGLIDAAEIAEKELEMGKCPLLVVRRLSNKNIVEYWDPNTMIH